MFHQTVKIFVALSLIMGIASCENKSCKNVSCPTNKTCYNGSCLCFDGYEGTDCTTLSTTKYAGGWLATETCNNGQGVINSYNVNIFADGSKVNLLVFNNLFNVGQGYAYVVNTSSGNEGNTIVFSDQSIGAITFNGQGTFYPYNNSMIINFNYTYNGASYACTHTFYKQ